MNEHDDAGFGCAAFGHLASAFVDAELPRPEMDRFATHLPGCAPCQRLTAQDRAIDVAAMPAYPRPTEAEWDAAWGRIRTAVAEDRLAAEASPASGLLRFLDRTLPRAPWMKPLLAAAAAIAIIGISLALRQPSQPAGRPDGVASLASAPGLATVAALAAASMTATTDSGTGMLSVSCLAGWEPVVWTHGGDDAMTVVQCQPLET